MVKNIQFFGLFIEVFISRHKKNLGLGLILGFFITLFILQVYPVYLKYLGNKNKIIGIVGKFNENNLPLSIQNQISSGLTSLLPSGEATPSIASFWEVNPQGTKYLFHLKPNLFWHNGKKFIGSEVNYKLREVTFTSLSPNVVEFSLKEPFSPFPVLLSKPLFKSQLVGLGIYKVNKLKYLGETISLLSLKPQIEGLPSITYKFYPSTEEAILAFKKGKVNTLQNMLSVGDLKSWKNLRITEITLYDRFVGLFFNLKNDLFKEKEVRQAFAYAIPPFTEYEKAYTPISPLSWAYSQKIRLYRFEPEVAKKILSKSPLSSSSSQLTISTYTSLLESAEKIANALNAIGINTKIKVENSIPADYEVFLLSQVIPPDPDQYQYWQSTQESTNLTHYSNLKIDKLLEDGRKTLDRDKRKQIYADFQRYLVDDAPVIFLYYPKVYNVERKEDL